MRLKLTLSAIVAFGGLVSAQFGPIQFAFTSELAYPRRVMAADVDGDGVHDVVVYNATGSGSIYDWTLCWYRNQGGDVFAERQVMYTGSIGNGAVLNIRDMDGDGDGDLTWDGSWYQNDGTGALTLVGAFSPAGGAALLLEDLDGDNDVDDLVRTANGVNLLLNNGSGTFTVGAAVGPSGANTTLAASRGDLDGDGDLDLMIGGNNAQVGWYANLGGGNYGSQQLITDFVSPATPFCGDVDGDGDDDVIGFGLPGGTVWFANDGLGAFALGDTIPSGLPNAIADFDGDNDVDFTVATGTSCNVQLLLSNAGVSWTNQSVEGVSGYNLVGSSYAAGDMNGDGLMDLLNCSGMDIGGWYPNLGGGSIGPRKRFCQHMAGAYDLSAADIDLDGDLDLATASYYGDFVCWYPNNGDGSYGAQRVVVENRNQISAARLVDINVDGLPDIVTNKADGAIIWNVSGGSSWAPDTLPGLGVSRCEVDLDGDLDLDLIGTDMWYENDGTGSFSLHAEPLLVAGTVKAADMNGDAIVDLVIGGGATYYTLINDGAGGFTSIASPGIAYSYFALGDMDGDGDVDAAVINAGIQIRGFYNDGSGALTSPLLLYTGPAGQARTILMDDLNGDGVQDVAWALSNGYTHQTYYNLGIGDGTLGAANLIDPTAESAADMVLADLNNDAVEDLVTARFRTISWQENLFYNAFRLRGSVYQDFDLDAALDPLEQKVPFQLVRTDANDVLVWTNSAGDYDLPADTGAWNVWTNHPSYYQVTNDPDTLGAALTVGAPIAEDLDFGMAPYAQDSSAFLSLTASGVLRCNTAVDIWMHLQNVGTFIPEQVIVDLFVHPDMTVNFVNLPPDSIIAGHYYWHVDSLGWFQQWGAWLSLTVGPAGSQSSVIASVVWSDALNHVFTEQIGGPVSCAFDPNDKLVTPQGYGSAGAIPIDQDWLAYTVRFQNTGTDTAFTVVILDTLDADLNWESMQILATSHDLTQIMVDADGVASFRFQRILLPDSNVNEPASHGFIKYRIAPVDGAPDGTEITNNAAIYFDLNEPVLTNTVLNTLIDCALFDASISVTGPDEVQANEGDAYQWFLDGDSILGATAQTLLLFGPGDYTVQVTSSFGCVALSDPFSVISTGLSTAAGISLAALPNPTSGDIHLWAGDVLDAQTSIGLFDARGRAMLTQTGPGRHEVTIERGVLPAGLYAVRIVKNGIRLGSIRVVLY